MTIKELIEFPSISVFLQKKLGLSKQAFTNKKNNNGGRKFTEEEHKIIYKGIEEYIGTLNRYRLDMELTCECCGCSFVGEPPPRCCSGYMCGCMGLPVEPTICSKKCWEMWMKGEITEERQKQIDDTDRERRARLEAEPDCDDLPF